MSKILTFKLIFGALFVLFFQIIIAPRLDIAGVQADMAIILTVWVALNLGPGIGTIFGFAVGMLIGVLTPADLGWVALILSLIGYAAGNLKNKLVIEPVSMQLLILLGSAFVFNILFMFTTRLSLFIANPAYILISTLYSALYSTLIGIIIFYIIRYRSILRNLF